MRKIKILTVNPSTGVPGSIEIAGDYTPIFQGRFYRDSAGTELPAYTEPAPVGYSLIQSTTFDIIENTKYAGRYTVYTPVSEPDLDSSIFAAGNTSINVNEVIPALTGTDAPSLASDGYITNISTYLLDIGTSEIVVPPSVTLSTYPIELMGRNTTGWGEGFAQNFINLARNFASGTSPANPFVGQTWYNTDDGQLRSWNGADWVTTNQASFGSTFRHTQGIASSIWTVNHLLGLQAPFIALTQCFVGLDTKPVSPADITFVSANQLTITFSTPQQGYVLVRS